MNSENEILHKFVQMIMYLGVTDDEDYIDEMDYFIKANQNKVKGNLFTSAIRYIESLIKNIENKIIKSTNSLVEELELAKQCIIHCM